MSIQQEVEGLLREARGLLGSAEFARESDETAATQLWGRIDAFLARRLSNPAPGKTELASACSHEHCPHFGVPHIHAPATPPPPAGSRGGKLIHDARCPESEVEALDERIYRAQDHMREGMLLSYHGPSTASDIAFHKSLIALLGEVRAALCSAHLAPQTDPASSVAAVGDVEQTAFQKANRMAAEQMRLLREVLDAGGTDLVPLQPSPTPAEETSK